MKASICLRRCTISSGRRALIHCQNVSRKAIQAHSASVVFTLPVFVKEQNARDQHHASVGAKDSDWGFSYIGYLVCPIFVLDAGMSPD